MRKIELAGKTFGRLTVMQYCGIVGQKRRWQCACECGAETIVSGSNLVAGAVKSCGCLRVEKVVIAQAVARKHGETWPNRSPEYRAWANMKDRCYNPKNPSHQYYVGIIVCPRWFASFDDFLVDMGRRTSPKHSLDRWPNNAGNYEPGNCRWATAHQQIHNRRPRAAKQKDDNHA